MTFVIARFGECRPQHNINYVCDLYIFLCSGLIFLQRYADEKIRKVSPAEKIVFHWGITVYNIFETVNAKD